MVAITIIDCCQKTSDQKTFTNMDNFSPAYLCAIATLAQEIYESGILATICSHDLDEI